jgi:hypothetical protein
MNTKLKRKKLLFSESVIHPYYELYYELMIDDVLEVNYQIIFSSTLRAQFAPKKKLTLQ